MAKQSGVTMPSSSGGLLGSFNSALTSKVQFGPKVVIYFSILVVVFIWILSNMYK